ncbi:PQQ-binding-like beta-propeller repeat protein [Mesorhizobium sp. M0051]|uniref:PQQ-binding-like beta-propeller repeat protein n=1 Tax=Mesorhizobium sp. M0051 TaxID=2956862 RepID=UPI00333BF2DC
MLPLTIGTPNNGGPLVTGGLIFIGATTDNKLRALNIKTGRQVWQDDLPAGGQTTPMTYEVGVKQYIVIAPGGHHFMETKVGDEVMGLASLQSSSARMIWLSGTGGFQTVRAAQANALCPRP